MRGALRRSIERLVRSDGLVDVFFLRGVKADQGLDRLDQPLCVANEIAVDIFRRQLLRDAGEQPGKMQYFAMRPAHRRKPVGLPQHLGEFVGLGALGADL